MNKQINYSKCKIIKYWFTETLYEGKKLYALHRIICDFNIGYTFEKITNIGENIQEVKRISNMFLKDNIHMKYTYILWTSIPSPYPFYKRDSITKSIICDQQGNPILYNTYDNYPMEYYLDLELGFQVLATENKQTILTYMFNSGRFIKALRQNGRFILPNNILDVQSYKTRIISLKELIIL